MPIEDVDFLKKRSKKQNYVFLVDSKERNRFVNPHPNEYIVRFDVPFNNVVGLEVLEATIPRTMYNVDRNNNTLRFGIYKDMASLKAQAALCNACEISCSNLSGIEESHVMRLSCSNGASCSNLNLACISCSNLVGRTCSNLVGISCSNFYRPSSNELCDLYDNARGSLYKVSCAALSNSPCTNSNSNFLCVCRCDPRTYDLEYVTREVPIGDYSIQTLVPALNAALTANVQGAEPAVEASITVRPLSNPPDVRNTLVFTCPYPFVLDMTASTIAETLGFDLLVAPAENDVPIADRLYSAIGAPKLYASVDRAYPAVGPESIVFDGPRGILRSTQVSRTRWVAQKWRAPFDGFLVGLDVALTTPTQEQMDDSVLWRLYEHDTLRDAPGAEVAGAHGSIGISQVDGGFSDATLSHEAAGGIRVTGNRDYWVVVLNNDAYPVKVFYNDVPATETTLLFSEAAAETTATSRTWQPVADANDIYYNMSLRVRIAEPYHRVEAPGIVSLVGERFVTLRCPEIEDNMVRSLTYGRMGLAKLRLGVMGFSENRVDFNKIALREFHPIGKLARMTLRFERGDGKLYDFKGVNHTIVFALHYYEPVQVEKFSRSILNPNYTGNFHEYARHEAEQEESSDDQSVDYNEDQDTFAMWKMMQQRNLPELRFVQDVDTLRSLQFEDEDSSGGDEDDEYEEDDEHETGERAKGVGTANYSSDLEEREQNDEFM